MRESDNLYKLIKSLSKTEKAYFKKYASRHVIGKQNKYTVLFDAISEGHNGYDEKEIKRKLNNEKFVKYFPVVKNYLTEIILKSLNSFYGCSNTDNEIKNDIRYIEILYAKDLFENCAGILKRSLKQAYRTDNFLLILELLKWKKNLINVEVYKGNQYINLEEACREEKEVIKKINNLSDYRHLSYRVRSLIVGTNPYHKSAGIKKELINILDDPLLRSEKQALSFPAVHLFYHILADIYDSLGRYIESFACRKKIISILENHAAILKRNIISYRSILNYRMAIINLLGSGLNLQIYNQLEFYINKLRTMEKIYPGRYSETERLFNFMSSLIFELRIQIKKGEFTKAVQNLSKFENGLNEFSKVVSKSEELHFSYLLAYGYFGAGKVDDALKWVNKIINDKEIYRERKLLVKSKTLNLIIHYELGNIELLDYLIKSTYRFLKNSSLIGDNEKIAIDLIKKLPGVTSKDQLLTLFAESLNDLKAKQKNCKADPAGGNFLNLEIKNNFTSIAEFDLVSWLESKISGKTFEKVVKEKIKREKNECNSGHILPKHTYF